MRRVATFYNMSCPPLLEQLAARGYVDFHVQTVKVDLECAFGPLEAVEPPPLGWLKDLLLVLLAAHFIITSLHRQRSRWGGN